MATLDKIKDVKIIDYAAKLSSEKIIAVEIDGQPYSKHGEIETYERPERPKRSINLLDENGEIVSTLYAFEDTLLSDAMSSVTDPTNQQIQSRIISELVGNENAFGWIGYDHETDGKKYVSVDREYYPDISTVTCVYYMDLDATCSVSSENADDHQKEIYQFFAGDGYFKRHNDVEFYEFCPSYTMDGGHMRDTWIEDDSNASPKSINICFGEIRRKKSILECNYGNPRYNIGTESEKNYVRNHAVPKTNIFYFRGDCS